MPLCNAGVCEQLATQVRPRVTVNTSAFNGFGLSIRSGTTRFISKKAVNGSAVTCASLETVASSTVPDALDTDGGVNLRLAIVADPLSQQGANMQADAPACDVCGSITVRSGTCYKCLNCGNSMGCS